MSDPSTTLLSFRDVAYAPLAQEHAGVIGLSFDLAPGGFLGVQIEDPGEYVPVCDLAQGLLSVQAGEIAIRGRPWPAVPPFEQDRLRARMGRTFAGQAWIANLNVDENILLAAGHHTLIPLAELRRQADTLARELGFPGGLPAARPEQTRPADLRRLEWVRAAMGPPDLLLLDHDENDVSIAQLRALVALVARLRAGGTAVLWVGHDWPSIRAAGMTTGPQRLVREGRCLAIEGGGES